MRKYQYVVVKGTEVWLTTVSGEPKNLRLIVAVEDNKTAILIKDSLNDAVTLGRAGVAESFRDLFTEASNLLKEADMVKTN